MLVNRLGIIVPLENIPVYLSSNMYYAWDLGTGLCKVAICEKGQNTGSNCRIRYLDEQKISLFAALIGSPPLALRLYILSNPDCGFNLRQIAVSA